MKKLILILSIAAVFAENQLLKKFTSKNLKFSANIYKEISKDEDGSFLVSPISVQTAFALLHAGAHGNTAKQISNGFIFPQNGTELQMIFNDLGPTLQNTGAYNLSSANKFYLQNNWKIKASFKAVATEVFNSEVQEIDFSKVDLAVKEINQWVEEKTYGKIKDLLSNRDINDLTTFVLVNAMYFKGNWAQKFSKHNTKMQPFYHTKDKTIDVNMMEMTKRFQYYESTALNAKFLQMNFWGGLMSMTFILPNEKDGLSTLEGRLDEALDVPTYEWKKVHVKLPKFKVETKIDFKDILIKLGVIDVFDNGKSDLSNIFENTQGTLSVDKVIQKAFINVEEEGTTAAAATAVTGVFTSSLLIEPPEEPMQFIADHPLLFILRHPHGILFLGRYIG
ncbi:hypothetical protein RI129_001398 [Pyrocoelia pectoralis]|uniref:Serpin domain-containing protein n=1 Tax=Pyrocoelia pectoralis TaxID=417401 RepID=A0AAN7VVG2_9COLE